MILLSQDANVELTTKNTTYEYKIFSKNTSVSPHFLALYPRSWPSRVIQLQGR